MLELCSPSDAAELAEIHAQAFGGVQKGWGEEQIFDKLKAAHCQAIKLPNYAFIMYQIIPEECEILTVAVHPDAQRRLVGSALLNQVLESVSALGVSRVFLEVSEKNQIARNLYEKFAFTEYNQRKDYYADGSDAILLQLQMG